LAELDTFFNPRSIAMIGASENPGTIAGRPVRILQQHGFGGKIYPVNPRYRELRGLPCYSSIAEVPTPVDLAMVAVPARLVPDILEQCAAAGVRNAMVFSSGFGEVGADGRELETRIKAIAGPGRMRVCGPNCEGFFNVSAHVPAGFSPTIDPDRAYRGTRVGPIAIAAQSGGLAFALYNRGLQLGLGFSSIISTGNEVDLDWLDYVEYMVDDPNTQIVLGFIESLRNARRLPEVARKAAELGKPIVLAKVGRSEAGRRAAASHTGSLVGSDETYSAAFNQLGIIRVDDVDELLDLATFLSIGRLPTGRRLAVLTASGGAGAWLADAFESRGLELPPIEEAIQTSIRSFIPGFGSTANPIDVTAQVTVDGGIERALALLTTSERVDTVATILTLASDHVFRKFLPELRQAVASTDKTLLYYSYTRPLPEVVEILRELGIPCYETPGRAAQALAWACWYRDFLDRRAQTALFAAGTEIGPTLPPPAGPLNEAEARAYLAAAELPAPAEGLAHSAAEAVALFGSLDGPVALKVASPDLLHKTDVGGIRLGLADPDAVRTAYDDIVAAVTAARPDARLDGVIVQRLAPSDGVELILGARLDPDFGPLVLLGLGGTYVEVLSDVATRLAPVSEFEAHAMIDELRGAALLRGARGRPPADLDALAAAVARFGRFAARLPRGVATVEVNPLLALPVGQGVLMLDAAVELDQHVGGSA
jgi:acetate---CoA ligase (ADP-forming)